MEELLLKNPSSLSDERKEALLNLLYSEHCNDSILLKSDDFYFIFHDLWSLFEIGEEYEKEIIEEDIRLKEWRIFLLDFFSARNAKKLHFEYLKDSSVKNFFIALYIWKKIKKDYFYDMRKALKIKKLNTEYEKGLAENQKNSDIYHEIHLKVQSYWYMNLFKFNSIYDRILEEVLEETKAVELLFGDKIWETISNDNLRKFMSYIESRHFSEVLFWKSKFQTEQFLKVGLDPNSTYVFCVQKDISMKRSLTLQNGLALAVSEFSQKHEHNFVFLSFIQAIDQEMITHKESIDFNYYFELDKSFGLKTEPINYKRIINYAFTMLKLELSHSSSGKIYLICNELLFDDFPNEEEWITAVTDYKKAKNIEIVVIYMGDKTKLQAIWFADKILVPRQLAQFE
ncbi:aldehyde dehydrogenase [Solibacillus sp. FSL R5-0449]|uniref:aldehyde dehydrogenase n=1 Tax=Solibacillus sp. FSL R5-0449 TaxID=2921639 RepID=UPI0030D3AFDF